MRGVEVGLCEGRMKLPDIARIRSLISLEPKRWIFRGGQFPPPTRDAEAGLATAEASLWMIQMI